MLRRRRVQRLQMATPTNEYEPSEEELDRFVLNKKEEAGIRYKLEKRAFHECFYLTEKYAECVKGKWFSVLKCRSDLQKLEDCLASMYVDLFGIFLIFHYFVTSITHQTDC